MSGISEYWPIYLALCAVPGIIAHKKGRSFIGFSALSLVVSPLIATIVALCARAGKSKESEQASEDNAGLSEANTEKDIVQPSACLCPKCGFEIIEGSDFCSHCGVRLAPVTNEALPLKSKSMTLHGNSEPLAQFLRRNRDSLKAGDVIGLLIPVATWLRDKHEQGGVFLRLFPGCLSVTPKGCIVRESSDIPSDDFVAPEQKLSRYPGIRADIFAYCAVLRYAVNQISDDCIDELSEVIAKGLNENPGERFNSMQELIYALAPFTTGIPQMLPEADAIPDTVPTLDEPVSISPEKCERKRREFHFGKKHIVIIAGCVVLAVLLGFAVCYFQALDKADDFDFAAAYKYFRAIPLGDKLFPKAAQYTYTEQLLNSGKYAEARRALLGLDDYRNASAAADKVAFLEIEKMISDGQYTNAILVLDKMHKPEAEELKLKAYYVWAGSLAARNDYPEAYNKIKKAVGYADAAQKEELYRSKAYSAAINYYHEGDYKSAQRVFRDIGDYKKTASYELLLAARSGSINKARVNQLMNDISFEDTKEVLVCGQTVAELFLNGIWKGDGKYFRMKDNGDISYNIPWFDFGDYYYIKDGNLIFYKEMSITEIASAYTNGNSNDYEKKLFRFTVVNEDCITVHAYKNNKNYTLYRQ